MAAMLDPVVATVRCSMAGSGRGPQAANITPTIAIQMSVATMRCGVEIQTGSSVSVATTFSALCSTTNRSATIVSVRIVAEVPRRHASRAVPAVASAPSRAVAR